MLERVVIDRIRDIYLPPHVSISQATSLGWTSRQMAEALASGEIELRSTPLGKWFPREELIAKALELWPLDLIEDALGPDAVHALPAALRTTELRVRLPRHHIATLEYRADQGHITVSGILSRDLDDVASASAEEYAAAIPAWAAGMGWGGRGGAHCKLQGVS